MACLRKSLPGSVLFSTENEASLNIISHLQKDWKWKKINEKLFSFSACGKEKCCSGLKAYGFEAPILDIEPPEGAGADYFLYASTHKSEKGEPSLTAHFCGNWAKADFGGEEGTLNVAYACKLKQILKLLKEGAQKEGLGWNVCMEVDHHGPTPQGGKFSLIFVEIGSTQKEWTDGKAGKIAASAIMKSLVRPAPAHKTYLGIGGGHYAPKFTQYMLGERKLNGEEIAIGHILPKYRVDEIDEGMILRAIEKSVERVEGALIDWKGLGKGQRDKIISILEKNKIKWERA
ncbi:D-tyrosyl-tRNA(Tyr) deacylase [Candidatus Micrarchaeota archaeon CG10_big_fil_rev_8_21_14_0_10_45_29]|nr:MAG: D-tyrosyl-tRNA(Tyr) deacylase [Candidatus Micrarchaeota archaeon CG10_big_fil_rev_8_21_14_0_10_45_29]